MSDAQKIPVQQSWAQAMRQRVLNEIQVTGKSLPAQVVSVEGAIVTVQFDIKSEFTFPYVTCPLFGPEYIRYPIKHGDMGVLFAADAYLGGVSGLGGGVADLAEPANLSALVFFPVGNAAWFGVDPDSVTIYGPNGAVLMDQGGETTLTLTPAGVLVQCRDSWRVVTGACVFSLTTSTGAFALTGNVGLIQAPDLTLSDGTVYTNPGIMQTVWAALLSWLDTHTHSGAGSGPPVSPAPGAPIAPNV